MRSEHDLAAAVWRKSTRSGGNSNDCVEVADNIPGVVPVRDSKAVAAGDPVLAFAPRAWAAFVAGAKGVLGG
ncbi:DUF397 domain-containing protein [Streptomyces montanisoli]|uniref:DUF397 domain-containing protein n=1 Tax=Streptomyces montanisoli TaxID=2798581 RepID=A0A940MF88_9ACTN|nr:DUF397 domain-containing protein [Streptomyces montanisoli]MBP0459793.1 DUF397 domain-containing protein [Streptomyces montanisoli]